MKLTCAPEHYPFSQAAPGDMNVLLYAQTDQPGMGYIGNLVQKAIIDHKIRPAARAFDLLSIALSVIAADFASKRSQSPDGWTRQLELQVAVRDQNFWCTQKELLERQLRFLTTDIWNIDFVEWTGRYAINRLATIRQEDCVVLLSGGLDSLSGTIDLVADGKRPYAVSQVAKGDKEKQEQFATVIGGGIGHIQFSTNVRLPEQEQPPAQRARSFLFLAYGVLAATALKRYQDGQDADLYVCENGFISINPPLTGLRLGSLSTRTTHPYFIQQFQQLLVSAGLRVHIQTPYQHRTKGELLTSCQNQTLLRQYAHQSTSCGRFARYGYMHCGRCVPCLIRRAAFHAWGVRDRTQYKFQNLSNVAANPDSFDDVWSAAFAVTQVQQEGLDAWLGATLNSTLLGDITPYKATIERGLNEVAQFLRSAGVL